jgi:hypothetical protein
MCLCVDITPAGLAISTPRSRLESDTVRSSASIGLRPVLRDLAIKHIRHPHGYDKLPQAIARSGSFQAAERGRRLDRRGMSRVRVSNDASLESAPSTNTISYGDGEVYGAWEQIRQHR